MKPETSHALHMVVGFDARQIVDTGGNVLLCMDRNRIRMRIVIHTNIITFEVLIQQRYTDWNWLNTLENVQQVFVCWMLRRRIVNKRINFPFTDCMENSMKMNIQQENEAIQSAVSVLFVYNFSKISFSLLPHSDIKGHINEPRDPAQSSVIEPIVYQTESNR